MLHVMSEDETRRHHDKIRQWVDEVLHGVHGIWWTNLLLSVYHWFESQMSSEELQKKYGAHMAKLQENSPKL